MQKTYTDKPDETQQSENHEEKHEEQAGLFQPAIVLMFGRMFGFVATFALPMVLVRIFDQAEFGTYKQLFLIYTTLFGIAQVGVAESLYYFLPNAKSRAGSYILNCFIVTGLTGLVSLVLLILYAEPIAGLLNNEELTPFIPAIGLYLMFMLMAVILEITMTVRRQHLLASFSYALSDIARVALLIVPVLIFPSLKWLMLGAVIFAFLRLCAAIVNLFIVYGSQLSLNRQSLGIHLAYALPFGLAGLIEIIQLNFHQFVVSAEFDAATFAIYAVGCLQIPLFDFLMTSTSNVMMVNMREKFESQRIKDILPIWNDATIKLFMVYCPLALMLLLSARALIVFLFTDAYIESVPIFMIWTLNMVVSVFLTDGVLRVFADTRFLILQNILRLAIIALLIQAFLGYFSLAGAVLVTLLATVVTKTVALARVSHLLKVRGFALIPWASLSAVLCIAAIAAVPVVMLKLFVINEGFLYLVIAFSTYPLCYLPLLYFFGPLSDRDKQVIRSTIRLPLNKVRQAIAT